MIGESPDQAQSDLEDAGLKVVIAPDPVFSDQADKDTVAKAVGPTIQRYLTGKID